MANHQGKGWFALTLSNVIDFNVRIPDYIIDSVAFAHGEFSQQVRYKIINYRFEKLKKFIETNRNNIEALILPDNQGLYDSWNVYLTPIEAGIALFEPKFIHFKEHGGSIVDLKSAMINDIPLPSSNSVLAKI